MTARSLSFPGTSLALLVACAPLAAQRSATAAPPPIPGRILVSGFDSDAVHAYRAHDGLPRGAETVQGPQSIVRGPDGRLYVCAEKADAVVRLDAATLQVIDSFVWDDPLTPEDENGPLDGPTAAVFGPGGDLFVASFETDQILRFDGRTGRYEGVFVAAGAGNLNGPDAGTKFGRDGLLYVPSFWNDRVLRYDASGAFVDDFVSFREGGLRQPRDLVQHAGDWYVASSATNAILRYDEDGVFLGVFAVIGRPYSVAFNDFDGNLYATSLNSDAVRVFDGLTGDSLPVRVPGGTAGLAGAVYLFFLD